MKVRPSVKLIDKKNDQFVWRKRKLYVISKTKPRNKQRQG